MAEFCREALAYISQKPIKTFRKKRMLELTDLLLAELNRKPWLIVLDGLERVLVAYHRYDAAQLRDEDADTASDQIAQRDPRAAIRPEDDELLRKFASAAPSKILVTSRLTPQALLNPSTMPLPGIRRELLPGLRPLDAEEMIRACEVTGDSKMIRSYLQENCDCHPLVIGALAGLINAYIPDPGNFDRWANDPAFGGQLNLAKLNLIQRRNHILQAAFDALSDASRQLLSTLALVHGAVDFELLSAFSPHFSPKLGSASEPEALQKLSATVLDLQKRGLLQYDRNIKRYDLHPVVRGVTAGRLHGEERQTLGQRVVDHFSRQSHNPYNQAESLDDVAVGLQLVRGLLQIGRYEEAKDTFRGDLLGALTYNLEADVEALSILRAFFPKGWIGASVFGRTLFADSLLNEATYTLERLCYYDEAINIRDMNIQACCHLGEWGHVLTSLDNLAIVLQWRSRLYDSRRLLQIAYEFAKCGGVSV